MIGSDMNKPEDVAGASTQEAMLAIGRRARAAAHTLSLASPKAKTQALHVPPRPCARRRRPSSPPMPRISKPRAPPGRPAAFIDRLLLNEARIEATAKGVDEIAELADPVGTVLAEWTRPNGLAFQRVRVPLGVIGIIYESRPNVTADAGALAVKAGNAAILRAGSESLNSALAIHAAPSPACSPPGCPRPPSNWYRPRPCRRRPHAAGPRWLYRCDRPARRQEPGRARAEGGARAGLRAPRRPVPHLRRSRRRPRHGGEHRAQRQDAAHRRLRRHRDAAGR